MLRESVVVLFATAFIGIAKFGYDIVRGVIVGDLEAVVSGFIASFIGLAVAVVVFLAAGFWLVRDDRARRREEERRHTEVINAIKSLVEGGDDD